MSASRDRKRQRLSPPLLPSLLPAPLPRSSSPSSSSVASLSSRERHSHLVSVYRRYQAALHPPPLGPPSRPCPLTDAELVLSSHSLLPPSTPSSPTPTQRLALRYYAQLYKEYAIIDLSHPSHPGLRWRTEAEVVEGRGQWTCGARGCRREEGLGTWRLDFGYREGETEKEVKVKVRLCEDCAVLLHRDKIREVKRHEREMRRQERERRRKEERRRDYSSQGEKEEERRAVKVEGRRERREEREERKELDAPAPRREVSAPLLPPPLERPPADELEALFP